MTTEETTTKIHPWQRAGLGIAPFRYVGYELSVYQAVPGDPNCPLQPGTSCDYCGQGIMHVCRIEDADGKRFKVGCDCVKKAFADTNKRLVKTVESAVKAAKKAQQIEREEVRIEAAKATLESDEALREELASEPHPSAWRAIKGDTRLDYFTWIFENGGHSGKLQITRAINKRLKDQ